MTAMVRRRWLRAVVFSGAAYLAAGIVFGALAGRAASNHIRVSWRLTAWAISAAVFTAHIIHERVHSGSAPGLAAWRVSLGVALGALGLAAAATVHAATAPGGRGPAILPMLLVWPVVTAMPAFIVAIAISAVIARRRQRP
jgi:hypothetical protein